MASTEARILRLLIVTLAVLIAGCAKEPAAYQVSGSEISITVERIQPYVWSKGWELDLIVRQHPNCQRRHHLKSTANGNVKIELYTPERGVFILRQGKRWYVTDLRTCGFDTYQEPPPEPGELVGAFQQKDGVFRFVENKGKNPSAGAADTD